MATKLFIGGLSYAVKDDQLRDFFATIGQVTSAQVITDRSTNQSKGFAFVEMSSAEDAQRAIKELNGKELEGRALVVSIARPQEERPAYNALRTFNNNNNRRSRY